MNNANAFELEVLFKLRPLSALQTAPNFGGKSLTEKTVAQPKETRFLPTRRILN